MYEVEGDEWEEDWDEEVDWNDGDAWYNDNDGADGDSAYAGYTADSMRMPLEQARMEFQDDWEPSHETKDDFETRIQRAMRTLEANNELNPVSYSRVIIRANYLEQALKCMKPEDPYENAPAIMRLKAAYTDVMFSSSFTHEEIEQHVAVITELLMTRWRVSASRFVGKVWSNDTTPDDKAMQLNREREAAMAPPGTRPAGKSFARPGVPGGGVGSGLDTPEKEESDAGQPGLKRALLAGLVPTCITIAGRR